GAKNAVRAVGTNALRVAKNAPQFLRDARAALGFPIEVIAGREEARLIYLGVAHTTPPAPQRPPYRRLVVDIGGGSTQVLLGPGLRAPLPKARFTGRPSSHHPLLPPG